MTVIIYTWTRKINFAKTLSLNKLSEIVLNNKKQNKKA